MDVKYVDYDIKFKVNGVLKSLNVFSSKVLKEDKLYDEIEQEIYKKHGKNTIFKVVEVIATILFDKDYCVYL